jgi:hypothetical protein
MAANVAGSDRELPALIQSHPKHSHALIPTKLKAHKLIHVERQTLTIYDAGDIGGAAD